MPRLYRVELTSTWDREEVVRLSDLAYRARRVAHALADDFGRFRCSPALIRSRGWGLREDQPSLAEVLDGLQELWSAGLLVVYRDGPSCYGYLADWYEQRIRGTLRADHPEPPEGAEETAPVDLWASTCPAKSCRCTPSPEKGPASPEKGPEEDPEEDPEGGGTPSQLALVPAAPAPAAPVKAPKGKARPFVLPDWVPAEAWAEFLKMRTRIRAPLTDHAKRLAVSELEKLRARGEDPRAVLDQSTFKGWKGLFTVKTNGSGSGSGYGRGGESAAERWRREQHERLDNGQPPDFLDPSDIPL